MVFLRQGILYRSGGCISHVRHEMALGVERYLNGGVTQKLLHHLGVYAFSKQQRRARVTQIVEAHIR